MLAMTLQEAIETTRIPGVAGRTGRRTAVVTTRPCRAPHQTMADVGLIGGGQVPCGARCRWPIMASSSSMHAPSADGMGLKC